MRSSNSLRVLPLLADVFSTGDFAVAAGVAASSASRALGRAEVAGLVIRVGNGTWVRCDDPAPVDWRRYPPEAARALWSPLLERVLDALYGDGPRRIGYLSGLAAAGEPMTVRPIVAADRHIGGRQARRLPFRHVRETVGCGRPGITAHAVRITERTWLSDPHRALLECAQFPVRAGNPEPADRHREVDARAGDEDRVAALPVVDHAGRPVAKPLDAMAQALYRLAKFPRECVIGMAGVLDSARMSTFIAMELNVSVENVHSFVLGGHGDTMVPLPRYSTVAGVPITELLSKERIDAIAARTANGGAEITTLVGTSAWYAPGAAAAEMVEAILKDKKKILPCSVFLQGEYGVRDLFVGVPVKLGARGMEQIIQIKLTPDEDAALKKSAAAVQGLVEVMRTYG